MTDTPTRVLVVDDSATSRALIIGALSDDPDLVVVGEARNGHEAIEMVHRLRPHVITMDIRMPGMDGFEATKRIMIEAPTPIIIVSGTYQHSDVALSMQAIRAGALTALAKPKGPHEPGFEESCRLFARTVKAMSEVKVVRRRIDPHSVPAPAPARARRAARVVAIGGSTGGPAALRSVIEGLPEDFNAPILVVQHLALGFLDGFARWLGAGAKLRVKIAVHQEPLRSGTVYVAPQERHLRVRDSRVQVDAGPAVGGFRPAATTLFESVADAYGERALAVILTGMGRDGVEGLRALRDRSGFVIAQDESSSVVFGMPRAAIEAGVVDEILPLRKIPIRLDQLTRQEGTP